MAKGRKSVAEMQMALLASRPVGGLFGEPALAGDAPKGLGLSMAGGGEKSKRQPNDFYPTPAEVTRAFLRVEGPAMAAYGPVWEPCGRGGAILRELRGAGLDAVGSDIVADQAEGVAPLNVLEAKEPLARAVVTNPPFAIAAEIILHLLDRLRCDYVALLLKSQFWHAEERRALFELHPPARIWALTWRPDFLGGGAPTMDCSWFVWERMQRSQTIDRPLPREAGEGIGLFGEVAG